MTSTELRIFSSGSSSGPSLPVVATTKAGLGTIINGKEGVIQLGTYPDDREIEFRARGGRWLSQPFTVMHQNDAWATDGINQQPGDVQNQWYRPIHGVGWYHGSLAVLASNYTSGASTIVVKLKAGAFASAGLLMMRGWTPAYTGLTNNGDGTWTFTGVTSGPTTTLYADYTPVIPYDTANAGDLGGWGLVPSPIDRAGEMFAAGFTLEESIRVYLNGSQDAMAMSVALYWWQYDTGDLFTNPSPYAEPSGHLGASTTITGNADPKAATRDLERGFDVFTQDWVAWPGGVPTKRWLVPVLYHRMPAGAKDTGEMYGLTHQMRWVGS